MNVAKTLQRLEERADRAQRAWRPVAVAYAVLKKFNDDRLNQYVVALGWYGFLSIYPLLLVIVTVLGFVGVSSLGHGLVSTLHQFPVVGQQFNPEHSTHNLHGSVLGLIIGLGGLLYGAQGVTQTALQAMAQVWNIPQVKWPNFLTSLWRSLSALSLIGVTFLANSVSAALATVTGTTEIVRVGLIVAMLVINAALFIGTFRLLTPGRATFGELWPGALVGSVAFTLLITVGSSLIEHQVRNSSATYGQFGVVIGLVGFLLLLAKLSLYGAELNPVLAQTLWPRSLVSGHPTEADNRVLAALVHEEQRRRDEVIGVGFGVDAVNEAVADARHDPAAE